MSSNAFTDERSMISIPCSASMSSGKVGPHMLSRAVVVDDDRHVQRPRGLGQRDDVVLQLAERNVAHAGHQADLVIGEDPRRRCLR